MRAREQQQNVRAVCVLFLTRKNRFWGWACIKKMGRIAQRAGGCATGETGFWAASARSSSHPGQYSINERDRDQRENERGLSFPTRITRSEFRFRYDFFSDPKNLSTRSRARYLSAHCKIISRSRCQFSYFGVMRRSHELVQLWCSLELFFLAKMKSKCLWQPRISFIFFSCKSYIDIRDSSELNDTST